MDGLLKVLTTRVVTTQKEAINIAIKIAIYQKYELIIQRNNGEFRGEFLHK